MNDFYKSYVSFNIVIHLLPATESLQHWMHRLIWPAFLLQFHHTLMRTNCEFDLFSPSYFLISLFQFYSYLHYIFWLDLSIASGRHSSKSDCRATRPASVIRKTLKPLPHRAPFTVWMCVCLYVLYADSQTGASSSLIFNFFNFFFLLLFLLCFFCSSPLSSSSSSFSSFLRFVAADNTESVAFARFWFPNGHVSYSPQFRSHSIANKSIITKRIIFNHIPKCNASPSLIFTII